jgi:predicted ATPase
MIHLRSITLSPRAASAPDTFPFTVPAIRAVQRLEFTAPVTFFVGENGSGKSTLLEAIAVAAGSITAGTEEAERDASLARLRPLARELRLAWEKRTRSGFFLRAEDFFGFVRRINAMREALEADLREVEEEYRGRSQEALNFARLPYMRELHDLQQLYGEGLDVNSHGESFLRFFQARLVPGGLYLLDEPETPLSPARQLTFLALLKQMVEQECQFIIATHSPILMAFPGATILSFDETPPSPVPYDEFTHVTLTRDFLNNPQRFLRHL